MKKINIIPVLMGITFKLEGAEKGGATKVRYMLHGRGYYREKREGGEGR